MGVLSFEDFELVCREVYDELPKELSERFQLLIQELQPEVLGNKAVFGYWNPMHPEAIFLVYEGFKAHGDFSKEHISNVLKHEFEHLLFERFGIKHSEHK